MNEPLGARRIVILDNYDSYVYNLFQRIGELTGEEARVFRNDQVTVEALIAHQPTHLVISPGPGRPEDPGYFGVGQQVITTLGPRVPLLGVCLGHQGIAHAFGGRIVRAAKVMHGKSSKVTHSGRGPLRGLPNPLEAMRYHSLVVEEESLPAELEVLARADDGVVMAIAHRRFPIWGVQFHPESIGTPAGSQLLANFLAEPWGQSRSALPYS